MQVATLFRESATLLAAGASMDTTSSSSSTITGGNGGVSSAGGLHEPPGTMTNPELALSIDTFNHPNSNKFKLNMKLEPQDDGYETSGDLMLPNPNNNDTMKCKSVEDPYSFIDEDPMSVLPGGQGLTHTHPHTHSHRHPHSITHCSTTVPSIITTQTSSSTTAVVPTTTAIAAAATLPSLALSLSAALPKKRGRKKKIKNEPGLDYDLVNLTTTTINDHRSILPKIKERKKHDRFNGMPEEEVSKRTLPDHLATNLDIIIVGINPGLFAAYKGHHYAGPGNHFWKCLYLSGLTPEQMTADEDYKLLQVGIGFTNMVQRPTKGSADLTRKEIKEGCHLLLEKLQRFKPKIAVFNGKLIYEVFSGKKDFNFGRQPDLVDGTNTYMWVMPSSSARCAQLPRAADKVPFYAALKKFRDYLNGIVTSIDDSEVVFSDARLKSCCELESKSEPLYSPLDLMDISNAVVKRDDVIPCKKKRGRPKKIKTEGDDTKLVIRKVTQNQTLNNCDFPKKKRGRPKKIKCEESDVPLERNTHTPVSKCFSSPSPIQSPTSFCHRNPQMTPPNSAGVGGGGAGGGSGGSNSMYSSNNSTSAIVPLSHQQSYSQSPRPHSQPFTHSDLSSEISAAISSDHLGSPAPTSPSLGPPDFDPPTSMPTEEVTECRFSSPAPSTASEQTSNVPLGAASTPYHPSYHTFGLETSENHGFTQVMPSRPDSVTNYKVQDMSSKSLSGLESLVDQIPNIAEGESIAHSVSSITMADNIDHHYASDVYSNSSPVPSQPYNYALSNSNSYGNLSNAFSISNLTNSYSLSSPSHTYPHSFIDHHSCTIPQMPVALPPYHHQVPYNQQFANSYPAPPPPPPPPLHIPSPNYPPSYYNGRYGQSQSGPHSPGPGYFHTHMFDRIKPDIGYGGF